MGKREQALRVLSNQAPAYIEPPYDRGFPFLLVSMDAPKQKRAGPVSKHEAVISEIVTAALASSGLQVVTDRHPDQRRYFDMDGLRKKLRFQNIKLSRKARRILGME